MRRDELVRALNGLTEAFPCYEPNEYPVGPDAMQAADLLARIEHGDAVLRSLGEAVGDIDQIQQGNCARQRGPSCD